MKALLSLALSVGIGLMLSTGIHAQDANAPKGKIAFTRQDGDYQKLFVINADGTDMKPIVTTSKAILSPAWSPDGKQIAYTGWDGTMTFIPDAYVINADGSGEKRMTDGQLFQMPSWSPNGKHILCTRGRFIERDTILRLFNLDGSTAQDIRVDGLCRRSFWSPDGKRLGYTKSEIGDLRMGAIYLINADGTGEEQFANSAGLNLAGPGAWSPDGKTLLTTRMDFSTMTAGLWLTDVTSKSEKQLTSFGRGRLTAVWSPDGKWIACDTYENGKGRIHLVSRDGQTKKALTPEIDSCFAPTWTK